jgi:hypothetical protein
MRVANLAHQPQVISMDTEVSQEPPQHGGNIFSVFITSLSAAIVVAGGFGIVFQAGILAVARLGPGLVFLWVGSAINAALSLWLVWTFARPSLSAAIVVAGFGIVFQAGILYLVLGHVSTFLWVGSAINAALTLWLALWTFARSWHVERRLKAGLEVDEPKLSILANFRGS